MVSRMNERGNESVAMRACRKTPLGRRKRERRDEWRWRDSGIKKKGRIELFAAKSCILARLADAARCGSTLLYCYMYYKIYYGFTAALLRREHRRPPVLLPATTGHVHETIDDLPKTSRNSSAPLSLPSVSCFWLNAHSLWATCGFVENWSLPVWRQYSKNQMLSKSESKSE